MESTTEVYDCCDLCLVYIQLSLTSACVKTPATRQLKLVSLAFTVREFCFLCMSPLLSLNHSVWKGLCLQVFPLCLAFLYCLSATFPCPHSAISNRGGLQDEARQSQTGLGLKEAYCEVTFFSNVDRSQVSSCRNYPHESCPL